VSASSGSNGHSSRASTDIVQQIKAAIFDGHLRPGDRLPTERELSERFGVSRATVRDAIRVLESGGLIHVRVGAGGGPFVAQPTIHRLADTLNNHLRLQGVSIRELAELRLATETEAAALAAQRATAQDLDRLEAVLRAAEQRAGTARSVATSLDFHLLLAEAAHSGALLAVLSAVRELLREAFETLHTRLPDMAEVALRVHRELYQALASRDAERARALMRAHLEDFEARRRMCELE
jgi:GntR family transcriptional repressor for pyruvate dehydrogenase complex